MSTPSSPTSVGITLPSLKNYEARRRARRRARERRVAACVWSFLGFFLPPWRRWIRSQYDLPVGVDVDVDGVGTLFSRDELLVFNTMAALLDLQEKDPDLTLADYMLAFEHDDAARDRLMERLTQEAGTGFQRIFTKPNSASEH